MNEPLVQQKQKAKGLEAGIVDTAEDLFSERARWVQTWILSRGLPFLALIVLVLSYNKIGSGHLDLPYQIHFGVAVLVLCVVLFRALKARRHSQQMLIGNYQLSLVVVAILLLLGSPAGDHLWYFWLVLVTGFWLAAYAYPKQWFMPGEFAAFAFMVVGICESTSPPLSDWLFVSLAFAPVIIWLQWKHQLLKPVLFLSALLVAYWLYADIKGGQVILAVCAALLMLWFAIYSVGQLTENNASSFIQSVGLGVISGLLYLLAYSILMAIKHRHGGQCLFPTSQSVFLYTSEMGKSYYPC